MVCLLVVWFSVDPLVEHRHDEQGEESGGEDAADHDGGDGALDRAQAGGNRHGDEAEAGDEGGHELGAQTGERAFDDGLGTSPRPSARSWLM